MEGRTLLHGSKDARGSRGRGVPLFVRPPYPGGRFPVREIVKDCPLGKNPVGKGDTLSGEKNSKRTSSGRRIVGPAALVEKGFYPRPTLRRWESSRLDEKGKTKISGGGVNPLSTQRSIRKDIYSQKDAIFELLQQKKKGGATKGRTGKLQRDVGLWTPNSRRGRSTSRRGGGGLGRLLLEGLILS